MISLLRDWMTAPRKSGRDSAKPRRGGGALADVIGLCRFSYPAIGGFQEAHATPEERARYLYAPERLEERFRLFEAITLPSLIGQTDPDFTFLVVIGNDFPQRARLEALLTRLPQAQLLAYPPRPHREVMTEAINAHRDPSRPFSLQFRLDDDDGVNLRFVAKLRATLRDAQPIFAKNRVTGIDFTRGHIYAASVEGLKAASVSRLHWTPALAIAVRRGDPRSVMSFSHHRLWQTMPVMTLADRDMYLRGWNPFNDSSFTPGSDFLPLSDEAEDLFRRKYGLNQRNLRSIMRGAGAGHGAREPLLTE